MYNRTETSVPYNFQIKKSGKLLYYFGANHSHNPKDEQYPLLKKYWKEFRSKTDPQNSVVIIEGGLRQVLNTEQEAIKRGAEADFITRLASKQKYNIVCPEPGRQMEMKRLLSKYSKEQIQYYYFARVVNQWGNLTDPPKFEDYVEGFLIADREESGWKDFDFSLNNMKKIHKSIFSGIFNKHHTTFFYSIINPAFRSTVINAYSQDKGCIRDAFIVKNILNEWNKGSNLFIVFGCTHAVMQESALRNLT